MSNHNETLAHARLQNIAHALAHEAVDALEPDAGHQIDDATRDKVAVDLYRALTTHLPPLRNLMRE
ncbi:Uncharacterised protein [Burkholderia cepacia]|uniref:Uncharacterized protein n=1 Tax=Burkholderia cepacia TaxID=292 RepID=A0AAE8NKS2_BURCE|nr:hypothetical protein [Burkholderia cepacia]POM21876.1 hypothetical protein CSX04_03327 [Burkholderia cepacia]SQA57459.1 Uncharacterised protein [Burkholderia cepacia]